jgi:hypothetical protein
MVSLTCTNEIPRETRSITRRNVVREGQRDDVLLDRIVIAIVFIT